MNKPLLPLIGWLIVLLCGALLVSIYKERLAQENKRLYQNTRNTLFYLLILLMAIFIAFWGR